MAMYNQTQNINEQKEIRLKKEPKRTRHKFYN